MPFCPRCANEFELESAGGICTKCGAALPNIGPALRCSEKQPAFERPSRIKRLAADLVDFAFCILVATSLARVATPPLARLGRIPLIYILLSLLGLFLPLLYGLTRDALGGKSVGKLLLGLTVLRTGDKPAGIPESIARNLPFGLLGLAVGLSSATPHLPGWIRGPLLSVALAILGVPALVIVAQIIFGRWRRSFDSWAGTRVIADRSRL